MTTPTQPNKNRLHESLPRFDDEIGLDRLLFFSDAVFAIAITLLALDIRLPVTAGELSNQELFTNLLAIWPKYLSYIISFLVIGNFWIWHHRRFQLIKKYNTRLLLLNLLMLMSIAFIPFPTAIISENGNRTATIFYALSVALAGILTSRLWWYASHNNCLSENLKPVLSRRIMLNTLIVPAVFLASIGVAFLDPDMAKYSWIFSVSVLLVSR